MNDKAPHIAADIRKYDSLTARAAVVEAWNDPGRDSGWHDAMKAQVCDAMPLLARALDRLRPSGFDDEAYGFQRAISALDSIAVLDLLNRHRPTPAGCLCGGWSALSGAYSIHLLGEIVETVRKIDRGDLR